MSTAARQMTAEQLLTMVEDGKRCELIAGELLMMSPAGGRHGWIASRLNRLLGNYVDTKELGAVFAAETGFLLSRNPDTVRAPDVAFLSTEKLKGIEDLDGFLTAAPDLAVEVISPNDSSSRIEAKAKGWIDAGTTVVLVVDPANRSIRVYRSTKTIEVLYEDDQLNANDAVPGWKLAVADVFPSRPL